MSPFRKDNKPTCGFYYGKTGKLYLHDFGTGEFFDAITVVMKTYNCSYGKALQQIQADIPKFEDVEKPSIERKKLEWLRGSHDLSYFHKYHITDETLRKYNVNPCRAVYVDEHLHWRNTPKNPIFVYEYESGNIKAYRPLTKDPLNKWKSNCTITDVQGWKQLPKKGKIVFITSSLKDIMVLYELGYAAIAFGSEGIPTRGESAKIVEEIVEQLKARFENVVLFLNNDGPGIEYTKKVSKRYNLKSVLLPDHGAKDPSDYIEKYNKRKTKRTINKLIKSIFNVKPTFDDFVLSTSGIIPVGNRSGGT